MLYSPGFVPRNHWHYALGSRGPERWIFLKVTVQIRIQAKQPRQHSLCLLPYALALSPEPSQSKTGHTVHALHAKDEPVLNLRSAVNHQTLQLPKARKHLIMSFQLCQREGPCPVLILLRSQKSVWWCVWDMALWVGSAEQPGSHPQEEHCWPQSESFPRTGRFLMPGALVPRGRHLWNLGPLPSILNTMLKPSLACISEAAGARNLSAYFPFYIPIPNLVFFFTFGPRILGKGGKAGSNKKAIQPKWINIF